MGNSQGRDNVRKRKARRKKTERLALARHGETVRQILGAGDASTAFQHFELKRMPLTYRSAAGFGVRLDGGRERGNWGFVQRIYTHLAPATGALSQSKGCS